MKDLALAQAKLPEADSRHPRLEGLELHSRLLNSVPREVAKRMTAADIPARRGPGAPTYVRVNPRSVVPAMTPWGQGRKHPHGLRVCVMTPI